MTWNPSMVLAALGKWSRMPLANPRPMSHVTRHTRSGSPSSAMKSSANRFAVVGSLPGVTLVTLRSVRSATTVMHRWPLAAGLVDADRLHARVVLVRARLLHVMPYEPPRSRVVPADPFGDVRHRLAFRRFHDHRLEQERGRRCPDALTAPSRSSRRAPGTPPVVRRRR